VVWVGTLVMRVEGQILIRLIYLNEFEGVVFGRMCLYFFFLLVVCWRVMEVVVLP